MLDLGSPRCKHHASTPSTRGFPFYLRGFSLIEILISTVLGLILLAGLTQIYLSLKSTYQLQHGLNTIQETGRFVTYFLNQNIRLAGYADCQNSNQLVAQADAIHGYNSNAIPGFLAANHVVKGTDIIVIKRCDKINGAIKFLTIAYFIADTQKKNQQGLPILGLYQKRMFPGSSPDTIEIASGVENMQIKYGLPDATGKDIAQYVTANQINDIAWDKVRSVAISLVLSSDRSLHKEWNTYVTLRERGV